MAHSRYLDCEWDWVPRVKKDGTPGLRGDHRLRWFTRLLDCERCGRRGSPRVVCERDLYCSELSMQDLRVPSPLCMRCWNQLRPIVKRYHEIVELYGMVRKLRGARCETPND